MSTGAERTEPTSETTEWDLDHRPRKLRIAAIVAAAVVLVLHVLWAITLTWGRDTGVHIGLADQLAYVVIGIIIAGLILLTLRIRVRAGAAGVEISGFLRSRVYPWEVIVGFTFPVSAQWARLELPAYEHVGIQAIQAMDRESAVGAMHRLREIAAVHKPSAADAENVADR